MFSSFVLAAVTAVSTGLPVHVAACSISSPVVTPQTGDSGGFDTIGSYQLHVHFTDLATEPIAKVVFTLKDGTSVADTGTFSPGIAIDHSLRLDTTNATECAVTSIFLADGTHMAVAPDYIPGLLYSSSARL